MSCYVTGGAGFIGSRIVRALEQRYPDRPIIVVDDFSDGRKVVRNLSSSLIHDCIDKDDFLRRIENSKHRALPAPTAVLHLGANSSTTEWDGTVMLSDNYQGSKTVMHWCMEQRSAVPFIYASSASVYGATHVEGADTPRHERPLNMYAWTKWQFDLHARRYSRANPKAPICGLRYFNVYGPGEWHKGEQSSVILRAYRQLQEHGAIRLFAGSHGYGDGGQQRDFVWVDDCVAVNMYVLSRYWEMTAPGGGTLDVGTGQTRSFNDMARAVIAACGQDPEDDSKIEYVPFPDALRGSYQPFSKADMNALRGSWGCQHEFSTLERGIEKYVKAIKARDKKDGLL